VDRDNDGLPDSLEYALYGDLNANSPETAKASGSGSIGQHHELDNTAIGITIAQMGDDLVVRWRLPGRSNARPHVILEASPDMTEFAPWPEVPTEMAAGQFEVRVYRPELRQLFIRLRLDPP
jgi:hypothetical protein